MKRPLLLWPTVLVCGAFIILAQSPPKLLIDVSTNSQVRLSWTNAATGFVVEELDHLPEAAPWSPVLQAPRLANQQFSVVLSNNTGARFFRLTTRPGGLLPDPSFIASPVPTGVATLLGEATTFLYTGPNPIQTGVTNGTIDAKRAAILRSKIKKRDSAPLSGVTISILNHPEFGQTFSRADGMFDLAVNGGGPLTVSYEKTGYCPVQRQINVRWQDYVIVPDVVMIELDPVVTTVALGTNSPMQLHQGSMQSDSDGARRAMLLFPAGTCGSLVLANGATQSCSSISVRATEFTVGVNGPAAMPAVLPPNSGYTYCVELSADEAIAQGASSIQFDRPVFTYVENFLSFPVGTAVPAGFYDRQRAVWVASQNGRVINILSVTGGAADVDTVGSGSLPPLALSMAERQQLATLYTAGQTLWRVPVTHFTPWDCNWPFVPPPDAGEPNQPPAKNGDRDKNCEEAANSVIEIQSQILRESVPIVGTPFDLNYCSLRVPGRTVENTLRIWLSGGTVPASLKRIDLTLQVAGRTFQQSFAPAPNQQTVFTWDGLDAYGRPLQGSQPLTGSIGYVYDGIYATPAQIEAAFASFGAAPLANSARGEFTLFQLIETTIGTLGARPVGLGGWTLSPHHAYDPVGRVLHLGDGKRRSASSVNTIATVAGTGTSGFSGDGLPATQARLFLPASVAVGSDGSLYIASLNRVRRVGPDGIITTVAGTGTAGFNGDGIPATRANLNNPKGVAVDPDGSLYIADAGNHRIRRVGTNGIIVTVAGTGTLGFNGDGILATQARLSYPEGVAVSLDGSLYIADKSNHRIRRVGPDGIITTVTGTGTLGFNGDGILATQARLYSPQGVAVSPDGSLYLADRGNHRIRRVGPGGIITTVAGTGAWGYNGDGLPATQAHLNLPIGVVVGSDGSLYITDFNNLRIRRVAPDGIITTAAGTGVSGYNGDRLPAGQANLRNAEGVAVSPDGSLYIADAGNHRIRRVRSPLPSFLAADFEVASEDGSLLYHFNADGRHLRTLDTLTGAVLHEFTYDSAGRLASVIEKTGGTDNVTTIDHDGNGTTTIIGPYGQRTSLALNADGYLASVTNPAGEQQRFTYQDDEGGLLATFTDPRNFTSRFTYDNLGRLVRDGNAGGGYLALARTDSTNGFEVTMQSALNRTTRYSIENLPNGAERRVNTFPDHTQAEETIATDGTRRTVFPDGTTRVQSQAPDPRFGILAPLSFGTTTLPSGLTSTNFIERTVQLADPNDLLSLTNLAGRTTINGRTYTNNYDGQMRTLTSTLPGGLRFWFRLDAQGRPLASQVADLFARSNTFDARGHLIHTTRGTGALTRAFSVAYDARGYRSAVTNAIGRVLQLERDDAGRVTRQTLPGGRVVELSYDANGNVTSVTPPATPAHLFAYNSFNSIESYTTPALDGMTHQTRYAYNLDRQLTRITRPDGGAIEFAYEDGSGCNCGRLRSLTTPRGRSDYIYHPISGQLAGINAPGELSLSYEYDGRLLTNVTWSGAVAGSVGQTYNSNYRLVSQSINGSNTISYQRDNNRLLMQVGQLTITRNPTNGIVGGTTLDNITDTRTINGFAELENYTAFYSGTPIYSADYVRDNLGRIIERTETIGGVSDMYAYAYDLSGRLREVQKNGIVTATYTYDDNGNRLSLSRDSKLITGAYDAQDRLTQMSDPDPALSISYTYTPNGELLSKTANGQTTSYDYDAIGNLLAVTLPDATLIEYLVDGRNRRVGRKVNDVLLQGFLYRGRLSPVAELDSNNNVVSRFVYGGRRAVPQYFVRNGQTYRIVTDYLGSVRLVVETTTGLIAQRLDYDEFGNVTLDTNPGFQPFGFAGGLYDQQTGLTRFGARDYDAAVGRWTTKDPIRFRGGLNFYAYVANNPLNRIDPRGLGPPRRPWGINPITDDMCNKPLPLPEVEDVEEPTEPNFSPDEEKTSPGDPAEDPSRTQPQRHPGPIPEGFGEEGDPINPDPFEEPTELDPETKKDLEDALDLAFQAAGLLLSGGVGAFVTVFFFPVPAF